MTFIWPFMLFSLLLVPLIAAGYIALYNRRRARVGGLSKLAASSGAARSPGFRRHIPPLLFLLSLAVLLVALARPQAQVSLPRVEGTVMLVMDVSASMGATDVEPSRLEAAKAAARDFINSQPSTVKIGVVSFSTGGFEVQSPTDDKNALLQTVNRLKPTMGTSLGQGIVTALTAIAVDAGLAWLAIIGVLTSLISAYYYLRVVVTMYMREGEPETTSESWLNITWGLTALATVLVGLVPAPLFDWASQAVLKLF